MELSAASWRATRNRFPSEVVSWCLLHLTLDAWTGYAWSDGLQLDRLYELDELSVRTRNTLYRIVVVDPLRDATAVRPIAVGALLGC